MSKRNLGSSLDDFLKEEGIFEEAQAQALKEVVAWQLADAMKKKKISKNRMATLLKNQPHPGRPAAQWARRYRSIQPSTSRSRRRAAGDDRARVTRPARTLTFAGAFFSLTRDNCQSTIGYAAEGRQAGPVQLSPLGAFLWGCGERRSRRWCCFATLSAAVGTAGYRPAIGSRRS